MFYRTTLVILAAVLSLVIAVVASDRSWSLLDEMAYATAGESGLPGSAPRSESNPRAFLDEPVVPLAVHSINRAGLASRQSPASRAAWRC